VLPRTASVAPAPTIPFLPLFWLAIPLYLVVNGKGPSYNTPDGIFVWNAMHISFLNRLPICLVGCALSFALRDGVAKSDAAIFAGFNALPVVADRATGSHDFNCLVINLVLGALVFWCIALRSACSRSRRSAATPIRRTCRISR
jgi:hypothetical protein